MLGFLEHGASTKIPRFCCLSPTFLTFLVIVALLLSSTLFAVVDALEIDWTYGTSDGGRKFKRKQCDMLTFNLWTSRTDTHTVSSFRGKSSYDKCDFDFANLIFSSLPVDSPPFPTPILVSNEILDQATDTTYFGCQIGSHCKDGNMKVVIKVKPDYVEQHTGFRCNGRPAKTRSIKGRKKMTTCKRMCDNMNGCIAFEYVYKRRRRQGQIFRVNRCKLYRKHPSKGVADMRSTCFIGKKSCG